MPGESIMGRKVDDEVLVSFIEEVRVYLPSIREHLGRIGRTEDRAQALEEAHRLTHTIRGAASAARA